jgi:hypothetical protein
LRAVTQHHAEDAQDVLHDLKVGCRVSLAYLT